MPWNGPPKIRKFVEIDIKGHFYAGFQGQLLVMEIENCDDKFTPIFSTTEKLKAHFEHLGIGFDEICQIQDEQVFFNYVRSLRLRLMIDPQCLDEHHTKWTEVIVDEEKGKFICSELN